MKLDRAGFILLMTITNLVAAAIDALLLKYVDMDLAVILVILVTGLANAIVTYLSTESGIAPPSTTGGSGPTQIVPLSWSRIKARLFGSVLRA